MPKLSLTDRPTKKVTLPISKGEVTIYTDMLAGDLLDMPDGVSSAERGFYMVLRVAKEWNFVGDDDQPLAISRDNLKLLKTGDFKALIQAVDAAMPDPNGKDELSKEKKTPSTSIS